MNMPSKDAHAAASGPLGELGFRKRSGGVFTLTLTPEIDGWLGLNTATEHTAKGEVEVHPVVGVSHALIERWLDDLMQLAGLMEPPKRRYICATLSAPLYFLIDERHYRSWLFTPSTASQFGRDLAAAVAKYGMPFMRSMSDLNSVRAGVEKHSADFWGPIARGAIAAHLVGDDEKAFVILDEAIAKHGLRSEKTADMIRRVREAFAKRLSQPPPVG